MEASTVIRLLFLQIQSHLLIILLGGLILHLCLKRYRNGLRQVPGPFLASFSNLWRLYVVWKEGMPWTSIRLHEKHGPLVRIGPKHVSVGHPEGLKIIYGPDGRYNKVEEVVPIFQMHTLLIENHRLASTRQPKLVTRVESWIICSQLQTWNITPVSNEQLDNCIRPQLSLSWSPSWTTVYNCFCLSSKNKP